ncbi:hypothetical protein DFJ63DRAFT_185161 [Scheffersomyces coipomensis]|uniref:uncharacterized protein n=1 Tax=Scheffersomyces coipomensis TaxID=1788519 RepID=UPI00315CCBB5
MPIFGDKPLTSITIKINQMSEAHRYDEDDDIDDTLELHLSNLLELIKIQSSSGATEAARAIRKKIKYGESVDEQLRALNILELLILNSGKKIGPVIARDDKLIDVLKGILNGNGKTSVGASYDKDVQDKVRNLAIGWKTELEELDGYKYFACLWQFIPKGSKSRGGNRPSSRSVSSPKSSSRDVDDDDDDYGTGSSSRRSRANTNGYEDDEDVYSSSPPYSRPKSPRTPRSPPPPRPKTSSPYTDSNKDNKKKDKKDKKKRKFRRPGVKYADAEFQIPQINYTLEAPKIRTLIGQCHTHTTGLNNALITLPAHESPTDNQKIKSEFEKCKKIRRKVLRYLQFVGAGGEEDKTPEIIAMDEEFLGSLIGANELLVETFKAFDTKCGVVSSGPAPTYGEEEPEEGDDESYSGESYYTTDSDDDEYEEQEQSISQRLEQTTIEGSSSRTPLSGRKSPPPPRPAKPPKLVSRYVDETPVAAPPPKQSIKKTAQNPADDNDPFGDSNEVSHLKSIYD